eukprot:scaffold122826_cov46-Prasinocladus_malaysianus.AAC.2
MITLCTNSHCSMFLAQLFRLASRTLSLPSPNWLWARKCCQGKGSKDQGVSNRLCVGTPLMMPRIMRKAPHQPFESNQAALWKSDWPAVRRTLIVASLGDNGMDFISLRSSSVLTCSERSSLAVPKP